KTKGSMITINLAANTDLRSPEEFRDLVVKQDKGVIVRLGEIADVELGAESYDQDVRFSGEKATFVGVWVLPTANSLDIVRKVREALPDIQKQLPAGMNAKIAYDSTVYIDSAIHDVVKTLVETLVIVIIVIFLFLGSVRAVIIPVVAIPVSLIGAAFLMLVAGFTINLLTLLAIVLSVGLVVDDAIVVVENIERHLHLGENPFQAAIKAARELTGPLIAMTITLAAVYAPIGFQGGLTGTLFREFALTLSGAVIISGVVALTLSPMMGSRLLRAGDTQKGYAGWVNHRFESLKSAYRRTLERTLSYRPLILSISAVVVAMGFLFYMFAQKELAPVEDQGFMFSIVLGQANSTLDQTLLFADKINETYTSLPETQHTFQLTNPTGGFGGMVTKPWNQRKRTVEQIKMEAAQKLSVIPGVRIFPVTPKPLPGGSDFDVEFVICSTAEPQLLSQLANELLQKGLEKHIFMFGDVDVKFDQPQAEIVFDRDKVRSLGVDLGKTGSDLSTMIGGNYINRFSIQGYSYKVIPQIKRKDRLNAEQLENIYVSGPAGKLVPLSTFASIKYTTEPRELKRFQQLNSATIQAALMPGTSLGSALKIMDEEAGKVLPQGYMVDYASGARQYKAEGNKLAGTIAISFILIFLVLAAQFESFRDPFIILIGSVPLAFAGALVFCFLDFTTWNIYSQVGFITLIGLVAKNGILIVEFANHLQETGLDKFHAVIEAAATRLRPILMTSVATVAGHFPLVIATGPGASARNSIGIVLVTGMIVGTFFTLFVVPTFYVLMATERRKASPTDSDAEFPVPNLESVKA
ncbi:MAG: efflux RND transporter permease subunit, partial [Chthoniobacterales bacterium]